MNKEIIIDQIPYAIRVEHRKTKNSSIKVSSTLDITLRVSQSAKERDIQNTFEKMYPWLEKTMRALRLNYIEKQIEACSLFEKIYYKGTCMEVIKTDFTKRLVLGEHSLTVPKKYNLQKTIDALLDLTKPSFINRCNELYELIFPNQNRIPEFEFKNYKGKWGICYFHQYKIVLNKRIIQLPKTLADYIIIHELLHFIYTNHGKKFKKTLQSYFPKQNVGKLLKEYSFILEM